MEKQSKPKEEKKPEPVYQVILTILGNVYKGKGKTFEEACVDIDLTWIEVKASGVIIVMKDDRKYEKNVNKPWIVRLVNNPITRQIWAKNFELFLK